MVRVLVSDERVRVWLNPNFADIAGASGPPGDLRAAPHRPTPLVDEPIAPVAHMALTSGKSVLLGATTSGGNWRVDYASVLPAAVF